MTTLLTDNFPMLAGAPKGIKKLRELILELAVRGKLVPQDPSDEPASELLKQIAKEKARLVTEGKIKKQKQLTEISDDEELFDLLEGWGRARFGQVIELVSGQHLGPEEYFDHAKEGAIPYLTGPADFGEVFPTPTRFTYEKRAFSIKGDILLTVKGSGVGKTNFVNQHQLAISRQLMAIRPILVDVQFTRNILFSMAEHFQSKSIGIAIPGISREDVLHAVIDIPPLAEQHRIVAKVDELMALCDRLETQQVDAEGAHFRLVQALLDSLAQACDAIDFAFSWRRLAEHFHTLFSTESAIDALKQTLLQLAVTGKLVPQDPSDEPASVLLTRIQIEKQRLMAEGKLKKQKPLAEIAAKEMPLALPDAWKWVPLLEVTTGMDSGWSPACLSNSSPSDDVWGVLKTTAVQVMKYLEHENKELPGHLEARPEAEAKAGDILLTRAGPMNRVGISCLVESTRPNLMISDKIIRFHPVELGAYGRFIALCLNAGETSKYLEQAKSGMAASQVNISQEKLRMAPIPLAPLAEQHRIVAKVDQLTALCDQLKTRVTLARRLNEQLAAALVGRALIKESKISDPAIDQKKARTLLTAEIVQQLHCEKRMGRVKLQKVISLAEHVARLKEIQSKEERYAAGPHDPALMSQAVQGLRENQWFEELELDDGKRYEYRPLTQAGAHRSAYDELWSSEQRQQINELIELMRPWDTARCERVATLYSAWNDLLIEGREANEAAILKEVLHGWNDSKLKYTETQWRAELAEMQQHSFLIPTGFGKRTSGGKLTFPGFEPSI